MEDILIVGAARTAIGKFGGSLAKMPASDLGALVIRKVLERAGVAPEQVSEVIMGQVLTAATGQNPARQAAIRAGLPEMIPAMTINKVCGSGLKAAMLGARGNSGVILSQLLSGFSQALAGATELTPAVLAVALTTASEVAYRGVSKPVEGTILTVAREAAAAAGVGARLGSEIPDVLERALRGASDAVAATPMQLDVLRKAGVVDSGGEGYRVILEGAWMWSTGRSLEVDRPADAHAYSRALVQAIDEDEESTFGFCTEFLLRDSDLALDEVKTRMEAMGESVIAVGDRNLLRVHLHTLRPGQALEFAVDHGVFNCAADDQETTMGVGKYSTAA